MVGTRSSKATSSPSQDESPPPQPPTKKIAIEMKKLSYGGSCGRLRHGCVGGDHSQASLCSQWYFNPPTINDILSYCSPSHTSCNSNVLSSNISHGNIILPVDSLKSCISDNFICRKCAETNFHRALQRVLNHLATDLDLHPCQSVARSYLKLVRSLAKSGETLYKEETINVRFECNGLAGCMYATCTRRNKRFKGHKSRCGAPALPQVGHNIVTDQRRYAINLKSIIGTHLMGLGYYDAEKLFHFLDLPYMSFKTYKRCEDHVGEKGIKVISMQVREEALKQEIALTGDTYHTQKYGERPALTVSLDMGWQKHSS